MLPVVLIATADRAGALARLITASPHFNLVEALEDTAPARIVARTPEIISRHPDAAVVVSLPPLAAGRALSHCAATARRAVVEAPAALDGVADAPNASVVHGWDTLPARALLSELPAQTRIDHARVTARGAPNGREVDLHEALAHALSWALRLDSTLSFTRARSRHDAEVEVALRGERVARVELDVAVRGSELTTELSTDAGRVVLAWRDGLEQRDLAGASRRRRVASADERLLATLLQPPAPAHDLAHARRVAALGAEVDDHARLAPKVRSFKLSRTLQAEGNEGAALGLLPAPPGAAGPPPLVVAEPSAPAELFALRGGVRPAAFLTLTRVAAERLEPELDGLHIVRNERDDHVELFVAHDAERAQRIATLQSASTDPSRQLAAIGELLGYPACCVAAFERQITRHDDAYNRHAAARRTTASAWPWELNDFVVKLVPFFPCRYDCAPALDQARRTLEAMSTAHPGIAPSLRASLARPFLVVGPDRVLAFDGMIQDGTLCFDAVHAVGDAPADVRALASALSAGKQLSVVPDALVLRDSGGEPQRFELCDPMLCMLLPFAET